MLFIDTGGGQIHRVCSEFSPKPHTLLTFLSVTSGLVRQEILKIEKEEGFLIVFLSGMREGLGKESQLLEEEGRISVGGKVMFHSRQYDIDGLGPFLRIPT